MSGPRVIFDYLKDQLDVEGIPQFAAIGQEFSVKIRVRPKDFDNARNAVKKAHCQIDIRDYRSDLHGSRWTGGEYEHFEIAPIRTFSTDKSKETKPKSEWTFKISNIQTPLGPGSYVYQFRLFTNDQQTEQIGQQVWYRIDITN